MGNVCTNNCEKDEGTETVDTSKNSVEMQGNLGEHCTVHLILGHYKQNRAESLLVIIDSKGISQCDPIQEYVSDFKKTMDSITGMKKILYKASVKKSCPYQKLFICVLPSYKSEDSDNYQQQFRNMIKQIVEDVKQVALYMFNTIDCVYALPTQMLLAVMLRELIQIQSSFKLQLLTSERKMMNMYKFQLFKTDACRMECNNEQ